ncbi:MAG: HDOD domain-containing protein [Myxococcaceae bacterium]|nr:HDOD domain-containing protein [Myxococcaceae bacterium]
MIGQHLLNYRVVSQLCAGGLGTVFLGEHTVIGRKAALKVLNAAVSHDEGMVARFIAEARAVNTIRHPNIVDVTDYGQSNGAFVIVMELLEGETIAQRLEKVERLAEHQVVSMLTQAASALGAAHERGIVHRDLKPENLFLTNSPDYPDFLKVLDFGIAKLLGAPVGPKTTPGMIIGTPAYMSPEQVMGDEGLDARSDVYAFGVVAYRMLTGRLPYEGNVMQLMQGHLNGTPPPLKQLEPTLSDAIERVVLKCLARQPADRYQTMKELRRELFSLGGRAPIAFSTEEAKPAVRVVTPAAAPPAPPAPPVAAKPQSPTAPIPPPTAPMPAPTPTDTRVLQTMKEEQAERVQAIAIASKLKDIISKRLQANSLKLPALPEVAVKCLEVAHNPDSSFGELARLIERDPFIASRVVRLSNSPVYGGLARITSVEGAVSRLGMKTLITVLQELAAEQVFASRDPTIRNAFRGIWEHCLGVGTLARDLCKHLPGIDPNAAYLAGLFHDIGKPVVAALLLEVERGTAKDKSFVTSGVWRRVVEECHREVGAIIAYRWYLPQEVAQAIAQLDTYDFKRGRSCANAVRLSNGLCQREGLDVKAADVETVTRVILQGRQVLRLTEEQVEGAVSGLTGRVQALTQDKTEPEGGSTRVFERSVG